MEMRQACVCIYIYICFSLTVLFLMHSHVPYTAGETTNLVAGFIRYFVLG